MTDSIQGAMVVLIGAPNAGKTSLYNHLTGSRYKTVNYPGATVEFSLGRLRTGNAPSASAPTAPACHDAPATPAIQPGEIQVMDTPGIVSIVPRSDDERVALRALSQLDRVVSGSRKHPDLVIAVVDATQPARHLTLVRRLSQTGIPLVVALTMNDLARKKGNPMDPNLLSMELGLPVVEVDGRSGLGVGDLSTSIEAALDLPDTPVQIPEHLSEETIREDFAWADQVANSCRIGQSPDIHHSRLGLLDRIALHPALGLVVFAAVMTGLFWLVFSAAAPFMDLTDSFFGWLGKSVGALMPDGLAKGLVVDGIIAGAGAVSVFIPQIAILFLALGILEDSGYLARGSMIIDRLLMSIGLNGKSFVPLLSGAACAIPAAMAARTIPGKRERLLTLLVVPLMSCSARLPVWGLLLGFLVPPNHALLGGFALAGIYVLSLVFASLAAVIGGKILRIEPSHTGFQVELPLWRPPTFRTVVVSAWDRTISYVKRAGLTILSISVVFWALMTFPDPDHSAMTWLGRFIAPALAPMGVDWKVGAALIAAFAAREVFVSALGVIYAVQGAGDSTDGLLAAMRQATFEGTSQLVFTPASVAGLVVFFLIALQCMTTVAVMRREVSTKFAFGQMTTFVVVAWVASVITVQGLRLLGVP